MRYPGYVWAQVLVGGLALSGCMIVPQTETTTAFVKSDYETIVPPAAAMGLEISSTGGIITVRASEPRVCRRETWDVLDVRKEQTAHFFVPDTNEEILILVFVIAAPFTLAATGLITAAVVGSDKPTVTRERKRVAVAPYECPVLRGNIAVTLVFPSGTFTELTTDEGGVASFAVPADEPDAGIIEVKANALGPRRIRYDRSQTTAIVDKPAAPPQTPADKRAACVEQRRQLMLSAQQIDNAKERGRLLQSLPVCPAAAQ